MLLSEYLNSLDNDEFAAAMGKCCASASWVHAMAASRPFEGDDDVLKAAADAWWSLGSADWLEAFAAHPQIGDMDTLRAKFANIKAWAANEQSGVDGAQEETLVQLAAGNEVYWKQFGYIFIVFATGKTAAEMLEILQERLENDPEDELQIAAEEQLKITRLRLEKLH